MRFGIHTLLFTETFLSSDLPLLDRCAAMGFDAVEIVPFDPDRFPAAETRRAAADLGLTVNLGYGMPEDSNPIAPDAAVRRSGVELGKRLVDLAAEAGAEVLGGVIYCGWGYRSGRMRTADEWAWGVESTRAVAEHAAAVGGPTLAIEPVNRFESHFINVAEDAARFVDEVAMPNVKVHLDTFHMIREEIGFADAIRACGPRLGYVHACENQRGVPGTGLVPWQEVFATLREVGYDGVVTIESFNPDMPRIAELCCIWRKYADSPEQLAEEGLAYLKGVYAEVVQGGTAVGVTG